MIEHWPDGKSPRRVAFVSDLHLFSNRCNISEHHDLIASSIEGADVCVWGGDLFDFRWSRLSDERTTIDRALGWLNDWYEQYPSTEFVYLDGNHDAHHSFRAGLAKWSQSRDRFLCGLDCLRIDNTLLLHGDVIEGDGSADAFAEYRGRWQDKQVAGRLANSVYDMAVAARVHRAAALAAHRRRATCLRLLRWMHRQPNERIEGITRVVFGHTHRRIDSYHFGGIEFYNGGAAIRHVPFAPVTIEFSGTSLGS